MVQTIPQPDEIDLEAYEFARQWRQTISEYCDAFFETTARFEAGLPASEIEGMMLDLEMAMNSILETPFPLSVNHARRSLLEAMASVLHGFTAALNCKDKMASNYLGVARRHLNTFYADLDEMGLK